ncbi:MULTISPECIES: UPF0175 family protein [Methylobacterium]|uniref:UPF0175 family protein n=1 Tax=Methylobacterium TaxID=407 RepID=UPI0010487447|nr:MULTISPECIES: UPF0175 family protein [Methylobacterium]MDR7038356.1 hypothetical protein [Methylobacterium sp. BE186]
MNITLPIPDDLARKLTESDARQLSRRALEAFGLEEFRAGRLTAPELRRMLGIETRYGLDGFLKAHGVFLDYGIEDLEQDRRDLERAGLV